MAHLVLSPEAKRMLTAIASFFLRSAWPFAPVDFGAAFVAAYVIARKLALPRRRRRRRPDCQERPQWPS